ncbi:uncharacterized protein isoform X3 [Rhodnius prolixus]|uniref:uncharacterized protein isoform X3 n=1 Tax=Rhodnius prolixus TaxID=13249 RepID=UPI003D189497
MISTRDEMLLYEKCRKFLQTVHTKEIKEHHSKLEDFKQWCQTQEEIPPTITVQQLVEFLNAVDYNLEKAQELILAHYRLKMQIADILFNQRDPFHSDVQNVWTVIKLATLPKLTQQGFRIVFTGLANTNPKRFNFFATFRLFTMAMEASMMVEGLFPGYAVIGDASGLTFHHIPFSSFGTVKKILQYVQIYIHKGMTLDSLYQQIPKELLPSELGGSLGPFGPFQSNLKRKVEFLKDWYKIEINQRQKLSSKERRRSSKH